MPVNVQITPFERELDFEKALADLLTNHGWDSNIISNPSEADLVKNWADIIYNNNRDINRLGDHRLTDTEMDQIIRQVNACRTPYEKSKFINGGLVCIKRDNPEDTFNFGRDIYLKIFDAREIRAGQSTYQIVRQPRFETQHPLASARRGDVMLLINGMPVVHIELKRSGVDVTQAVTQIKKYTHEGVFSRGIFSLVQVFVAMTPEKTLYFANPGAEENFSPSFYFHWANFNNEEEFDWKQITANFLSIPMAHQMIGYYTIADDKDETLKVLRSYQYFAATKISERVKQVNWDDHQHKGGFIWHTTGSGKTMTSFKSAQLISNSGDADKVVFLLDRVELSVQSLDEYRGFAGENDSIQDSDNTKDLISKLESDDKDDCLIVTSIQKMSRINPDNNVPESTINKINSKRVVFIIDECHRGVFGKMLLSIKNTFPRAVLFGFTGTPVFEENAKKEITTEVIFGDMLHKYTLGNGIPDGNVLGFDLKREDDMTEYEMREMVALHEAEVDTFEQIGDNPEKKAKYDTVMNDWDILKVEDKAKSFYQCNEHHIAVANKIVAERPVLSVNGKFHAILATKNIPEAIEYYHIFKTRFPEYHVATVFDDSIDNEERAIYKEDAILEMLEDYNNTFGTHFQQSTYAKYKKDVARRLAHKKPYAHIDQEHQLDLLIVVTQMLTGYDSKYVNTLYADKLLEYVDVIQAFSRTNRLFGPEKPHGIIKFFTRPNRMEKNIEEALELYVDQPLSVFVDKLEANLEKINKAFRAIEALFTAEGIEYFNRLPMAEASRKKFAKEFCDMTKRIGAAKMQGFTWDKSSYEFEHTTGWVRLEMALDEQTYLTLLQRYRELFKHVPGPGGDEDVYQHEAYITETGVGTIDAEYINSKFIKFVKNLYTTGPGSDELKQAQAELHQAFSSLSQRNQRTALTILRDIQSGDLRLVPGMTIYDYINEYQKRECDSQIFTLSEATGLNIEKLGRIIGSDVNEQNIDEHGRFTDLMDGLNGDLGVDFVKKVIGTEVRRMFVKSNVSSIVRRFILDPSDRDKIIYALQNEGVFLDQNVPDELPEPEENAQSEPSPVEPETLSDEEKHRAVQLLVMKDLRRISGMPPSKEVVEGFFKIINIPSLNYLDGVAIDMFDTFNELFGRRTVNFVKKHVCSGTLLIKFEVFLKKIYYLLNGTEVPPKPGETKVTLVNAIYALPFLRDLRYRTDEKSRVLSSYLELIKTCRNTQEGNGAHYSTFATEEEMDKQIKAAVTMYMYVTGMSLKDLRHRYPKLDQAL